MSENQPLAMSTQTANAVYDALVTYAAAPEANREAFVHAQSAEFVSVYQFDGALGSGGKFWRGNGYRADDTWGERWHTNAFLQDTTPAVRTIITTLSPILDRLRAQHEAETNQHSGTFAHANS